MRKFALDQDFLSRLAIPPRPEIVSVLFQEMSRDEPDLGRVSRQISADVGLAAAMLKIVNSPAFGRDTKARSVAQAVSMLGMRNVSSIATGLAIRQSLGGGAQGGFERFWDTAEKVALGCSYLAQALRGIPVEEAFTVGLFHDCGIPMLMRRFPNYREALELANRTGDRSFFDIENEAVGTDHGVVGYFLARSWNLDDDLSQALLRHHEVDLFASDDAGDRLRNYVGIIHFAQHIHHRQMRSTVDVEWLKFKPAVLAHFALSEEDYINLVDGAQEAVNEELAAA